MRHLLQTFIILFTLAFISCSSNGTGPDPEPGDSEETATYNLDVTVTPSEGGSISPSTSETYEDGEQVELQATANDEYLFTGWTGDITSSDNPFSLTMDQNYTITANFELKNYELAINTEGEGAVSEKIIEQQSKEYEHGTVVELTANSAEGYKFVEWTGDVTSSDNPVTVIVDNPKEVTAVFEKKNYPLTVNTNGEGAVSEQLVQQKTTDYAYGAVVELTANPAKGWQFSEWQGGITGSSNPAQITVEDTLEVTAVFERQEYALNLTVTGEGSITKNPDEDKFLYDSDVDLEANAAQGWTFVEWQGDISGTDNPITVSMDTTKTITAVFESIFSGGMGTESNPFKIATVEDLQKINNVSYADDLYFLQTSNIDASGTENWNLGKGFEPLTFSGVYDGQGYVISGLTIDRDNHIGLFASIGDYVEVRNVKLENVDITGSGRGTGGLAGMVNQHGTVSNSSVTGKVHCTDRRCGGLVGDNYGNIENSFADVTVTSIADYVGGLVGLNWGSIQYSYAIGNVSGIYNVGGLVGRMTNNNDSYIGQVNKSYAQGEVTGKDRVGGLVGSNGSDTRITYSYASGKVTPSTTGITKIGGLIGIYYETDSVVQQCYWDTESTGQTEGAGGSTSLSSYNYGLTTSEMTGSNAPTNMSEFDFVSIWQVVDGDYPSLFWE